MACLIDKKKKVLNIVIKNPAKFSRVIAKEVEVEIPELKEIYNKIRGKLPALPDMPFGESNFTRRILESVVLSDRPRLDKYLNNEFVFPARLELHLGPACQCACRFCWRWESGKWKAGENGLYRKKDNFSLLQEKDITSLFLEFKERGGSELFFSGGLEFFTSPLSEHAIREASRIGIKKINVYTNGVSDYFDKSDFLELIVKSVSSIRFSIHANSPATYAFVQMPHKDQKEAESEFEKVRNRIKKLLIERNSQEGNKRPRISVSYFVIGDNLKELEGSIFFMKGVGVDEFDIRIDMQEKQIWFTKTQEKDLTELINIIKKNSENGKYRPMKVTARIEDPGKMRQELKSQMAEKCYIPIMKPVITPWGDVYTCCYRAHPAFMAPNYELGRYPKDGSLFDILKKKFDSGFIPYTQCKQCTDWEMAYNTCVEKVIEDRNDGIEPTDLPF